MKRMALFEFELMPVEDIKPWGEAGNQSLGWYPLTDGFFRMPVGDQVLFRYSDERMSHWKGHPRDVSYMVAAFARDVLGSVGPGAAPLPERVERLASDWDRLVRLRAASEAGEGDDAAAELYYRAWRWLGARSPGTWYLNPHPNIYFVRIGDDVHIHWDSEFLADGEPIWAARRGVHVLPVAAFVAEGRDFADRLLAAMEERIAGIEAGTLRPQIAGERAFASPAARDLAHGARVVLRRVRAGHALGRNRDRAAHPRGAERRALLACEIAPRPPVQGGMHHAAPPGAGENHSARRRLRPLSAW